MKIKRGLIITLLLTISLSVFAYFEKIELVEKTVLGFKLSTSNSYEERISIMETKLFGKNSIKTIEERETDVYNILFSDGKYYSLMTKTANAEEYLFKKKNINSDLISRIEKIEMYIFNKVDNGNDIVARIRNIYKYLSLKESDFILKGNGVAVFENIRLKIIGKVNKFRKNENIEFELADDVDGILFAGDKVYGMIKKVKSAGLMGNEEIEVVINKIVGSDNREYDIYKRFVVTGNKKNLIGGKTINIKKVIYID